MEWPHDVPEDVLVGYEAKILPRKSVYALEQTAGRW